MSSVPAGFASSLQTLDSQARQRFIVAPVVFLGVSVVVCALVGALFGQLLAGAIVGVFIAMILTVSAIAKADAIVLSRVKAAPADPVRHQRLLNVVEGLSVTAGLQMPEVYVIEDDAPNACVVAGGRHRNALVVTTGLLARLDRIQLEGVVSHLVVRIRSGHIQTLTRIAVLIGAPVLLGESLARRRGTGVFARVLFLTAYIVGPLMRWLVGVQPDSVVDVVACRLTRYPPGLAAALDEISQSETAVEFASMTTAHLWFVDPLFHAAGATNGPVRLHSLFASHSPLGERIALLKEM
jgi:heat shock protein HtpX